jgi:microcystin-dependent protein
MSSPFLAEIRIFAGNFAPTGHAFCDGQIISITQNTALFSLLGTNYGGNGVQTFGLPNLQGRAPMALGNGPGLTPREIGETDGEPTVTLTTSQMPAHTHGLQVSNAVGDQSSPVGNVFAEGKRQRFISPLYASTPGTSPASGSTLGTTGGSGAHNNLPPYAVLNFIIALQGIYPSRS